MKRKLCFLLPILLMLSVVGCSSTRNTVTGSPSKSDSATMHPSANTNGSPLTTTIAMPSGEPHADDDQYCFEKPISRMFSIAETADGLYFISGPQRMFLYYMDKKTGNTTVLCAKPDCLHANEPDPEKIANCNAWFQIDSSFSMLYSDPYLYMVSFDISSEACRLVRVSKDGTQRKEVYTFRENPGAIIIHRGYLYYTTDESSTFAGSQSKEESKACLYRIALNSLNKAPELLYEAKGIRAFVDTPMAYLDTLYFSVSYFRDEKMEQSVGLLMGMKLDGSTPQMLAEDAGQFQICGDKIVYYWVDKTITRCDLDGKNPIKLLTPIADALHSDNTFIVIDSISHKLSSKINGSAEKRKLYFCDLNGKELQQIDIDALDLSICYGSDEKYTYLLSKSGENQFGNIYSLYRIDKTKIPTGTATLETVFTFTPSVEEKGVITTIQ